MGRRTTRTRKTKVEEQEIKQEEVKAEETVEQPKEEQPAPVEEETKKEQPKQNKPKNKKIDIESLDTNNPQYVEAVLTESKSLDDLLDKLRKSPLTKLIAGRLKAYIDAMGTSKVLNPKDGAAKNYEMYNLIISIAKNPDYNKFQLQFKVLNKAFLLGRKGVFSPINLSRYDFEWRWGLKSKSQYEKLVELITTLANPGNRKQIGKTISLESALSDLPEAARENITRFYTTNS